MIICFGSLLPFKEIFGKISIFIYEQSYEEVCSICLCSVWFSLWLWSLQYNIDYRRSPGSSRRWRGPGEARSTASSDNESMYSSSMSDGLNKSSSSNKQFSASNTSLDRQPSGPNSEPLSHWGTGALCQIPRRNQSIQSNALGNIFTMTANFTMDNWELLIANMLELKVCIPFPLIPMDFHIVQYFSNNSL